VEQADTAVPYARFFRDGKLRIFAPFTNNDYRNVWADNLRIEGDGTLDTYYTQKAGEYREEQVEPDRSKWWANGNIICNELSKKEDKDKSQIWGDHFLAPLRDMLGEACREREMPDCEFFLNKRDYPQLKVNVPRGVPVEPYGFIFDKVCTTLAVAVIVLVPCPFIFLLCL